MKEGVSGLGTISYYDPETGGFGALGHGVNDQALHTLLPLREGSLVEAAVTGVTRGEVGSPGSLQGTFSAQEISWARSTKTPLTGSLEPWQRRWKGRRCPSGPRSRDQR